MKAQCKAERAGFLHLSRTRKAVVANEQGLLQLPTDADVRTMVWSGLVWSFLTRNSMEDRKR